MKSSQIGRRLVFLGILTAFVGGAAWLICTIVQYWPTRYPAYVRLTYRLNDTDGKGKEVVNALRRCLWHEPPDCRVKMRGERSVEVCFGTDPEKVTALRDKLKKVGVESKDIMKDVVDVVENTSGDATPAQADIDRVNALADKSDAMTRETSELLLVSHLRGVEDIRAIIERGGGLMFRVLAERSAVGDQGPALLHKLKTDGPQAAGAYTWCELVDRELMDQPDVVAGQHDGRPYVLACATPELTMVQDRAEAPWSVQKAGLGLGSDGRLAVNFTLDPAGGRQLEALTARANDRRLAVVVAGRVYAAPMVKGTLGASGQISGPLSYSGCVRLAGYLLAPAEPLGLQAGPVQGPLVKRSLWVWPAIPSYVAGGPVLMFGAAVGWFGMRRRSGRAVVGTPGSDSYRETPGEQGDSAGTEDVVID